MTVNYLFVCEFTKNGAKATPSIAPTIDIADLYAPTGALLVSAGAPTQLTNMTGVYIYSYNALATTKPVAIFRTTDTSVDLVDLPSYPILFDADGKVQADAGAVSDPWGIDLPNGYVAGKAGYILGNLQATVFPSGANPVTITIRNSLTTFPIDGAKVWISTDLAGANVVWSGATDAFGVARNVLGELPALNNGLYYRWVQDSGYTDSNPTAMNVSP